MVEAQVLVDVGGGGLSGGDGPDDGGGAGDAVAAGEDAHHVGELGAGVRQQRAAPLNLNAGLLQPAGLNALADGHDNGVRRNAHGLHRGGARPGTARLVHLANDLGLGPQCRHVAVLVGLDAQGGLEGQHLRALGDGPLHLFRLGGHVLLAAAVDAGHLVRPKADGGAGHVHGNVAAADDHHVLSGEVRHLVVTDVAQQLHGGDDAQAVLPLNAGLLVRVGADGEIQAVVLLLQLVKGHVHTHIHAGMYLDTQREDGGDLRVQLLPGQTVAGDAVAHHAPQLALLFVHGDPVAHKGQVVCGGETAGAAAHNGHGLAGGGGGLRLGHIPGVVHGVTLEPPDIQSVVHHVPAAAGLAGVLADVGAGRGEGIVLADEADGIAAASLADEGDIARDVHPGGA